MPALVNVIVGCVSTAKKSSLRRWASRSGVFVSMLAAWMTKLTVDRSGWSASNWMLPA